MIIDSHCHIHFREFRKDLDEVLARAAAGGVGAMLAVGIDPGDCGRALQAARSRPGIYVALGIHPQNGGKYGRGDVRRLSELVCPQVVAVGETGFDLYRTPQSEPEQKDLFLAHIELAGELGLPLVLHDRDAHEQTVRVLDEAGAWGLTGVFHCFSGDADLARHVTEKGFFVSIPGVVTYRNAQKLQEVVRATPLEHLLVETDAPYLTPEPHRGRRNEPLHAARVIDEVARIKGLDRGAVARVTTDNFCRLFLKGGPVSCMECA
jgi:TatD DNase family protein